MAFFSETLNKVIEYKAQNETEVDHLYGWHEDEPMRGCGLCWFPEPVEFETSMALAFKQAGWKE